MKRPPGGAAGRSRERAEKKGECKTFIKAVEIIAIAQLEPEILRKEQMTARWRWSRLLKNEANLVLIEPPAPVRVR